MVCKNGNTWFISYKTIFVEELYLNGGGCLYSVKHSYALYKNAKFSWKGWNYNNFIIINNDNNIDKGILIFDILKITTVG